MPGLSITGSPGIGSVRARWRCRPAHPGSGFAPSARRPQCAAWLRPADTLGGRAIRQVGRMALTGVYHPATGGTPSAQQTGDHRNQGLQGRHMFRDWRRSHRAPRNRAACRSSGRAVRFRSKANGVGVADTESGWDSCSLLPLTAEGMPMPSHEGPNEMPICGRGGVGMRRCAPSLMTTMRSDSFSNSSRSSLSSKTAPP